MQGSLAAPRKAGFIQPGHGDIENQQDLYKQAGRQLSLEGKVALVAQIRPR